MNEVPTLQEEVTRKAIDTVEKLALDREYGRITEAQYKYGLDVLWNAMAGIAGSDFMIMMEVAQAEIATKSFLTKCYFLSPTGKVARLVNNHTGIVVFETELGCLSSQRRVYNFRDEPSPAKQAKAKMNEIYQALFAKNFHEI